MYLRLRWSIVSILILLCQGFVFEENLVSVVFEAMIVLMILTAVFCTVWSLFRRKIRLRKSLQVTRQSLNFFRNEDIIELFVVSSMHQFEVQGGILDLKISDVAGLLKQDVLKRILEVENRSQHRESNTQVILAMLPTSAPQPGSVEEVLKGDLPNYNTKVLNQSSQDLSLFAQSTKSPFGIVSVQMLSSTSQNPF
jgi:hypothetical protein